MPNLVTAILLNFFMENVVKRAIRSLLSEAYTKASAKDKSLPRIANHAQAIRAFALLPKGALALHVSKVELPASRNPIKRIKGLWTVQIEREQRLGEDLYYVWLNQPRTWKQTIVALGIVFVMLIITMFPLWPPILRLAMWYLAIGILGLMGAFFAMSILRLIIYVGTAVVVPPGLWLYPNLFEDVGFFDSFRPLWGWHSVSLSSPRWSLVKG